MAAGRNRAQQLTPKQAAAVELLALGRSDAEVAGRLGVQRSTVRRWRTDHAGVRAALNARRAEVWGLAGDRLRSLVPVALDVLAGELAEEVPVGRRLTPRWPYGACPRSSAWTSAGSGRATRAQSRPSTASAGCLRRSAPRQTEGRRVSLRS